MRIWYSDSDRMPPTKPMGNGHLLIWEEGASVYSFRAGYSSPHLFSLSPDFGGAYHEISTELLAGGTGFRHRLFFSDDLIGIPGRSLCDLQITDLFPSERSCWIRRMDGITALHWHISIPSYVRTVYHPGYRFGKMRADALFLTLPAGTVHENGIALLKEQTVVLVFAGTLRYDPADGSVYYGGDIGELYCIACDDPQQTVRLGDSLLQAFSRYRETPSLHPFYGEQFQTAPDEDECDPATPEGLRVLEAMQAASGAVTVSVREPFAAAADLPALTEVLLQTGQSKAAKEMLLYWTAKGAALGYIPTSALCADDAVWAYGQSDPAADAAYLLASVRLCQAATLERAEEDRLYKGMRSAFSGMMQRFRDGMLPFSGRTAAFDAGILGRELLFQGSAEVTALAICAGREFLSYCQERGKRSAKGEGGYSRILEEAESSFEKNFTHMGSLCRNAPRLEGITRRPRFIRGVCTLCQKDGAYPTEDTLELDKYGRYLCRRCFAARRQEAERIDPAVRYRSPRAVAAVALCLPDTRILTELLRFASTYLERTNGAGKPIALREADTDPLILLALRKRKEEARALLTADLSLQKELAERATAYGYAVCQEGRELGRALLELLIDGVKAHLQEESEEGTLSSLLYDRTPLGAKCSAGATALRILSLL